MKQREGESETDRQVHGMRNIVANCKLEEKNISETLIVSLLFFFTSLTFSLFFSASLFNNHQVHRTSHSRSEKLVSKAKDRSRATRRVPAHIASIGANDHNAKSKLPARKWTATL